MAISPDEFRKTLSQFASGVTVVTTASSGSKAGITVSAFCSLSLEPPLVLICIEKSVRSHEAITTAGHFAVNVLTAEQQDISNLFASRTEDKFENVATTEGSLGDPLIEGCLANFECRIHDRLPGGDHTIFVGEVVESQIHDADASPLLYFRGGYQNLG